MKKLFRGNLEAIMLTKRKDPAWFRITHIFSLPQDKDPHAHLAQASFWLPDHAGLDTAQRDLENAYARVLHRIWTCERNDGSDVYLQMETGRTPEQIGFAGKWRTIAER